MARRDGGRKGDGEPPRRSVRCGYGIVPIASACSSGIASSRPNRARPSSKRNMTVSISTRSVSESLLYVKHLVLHQAPDLIRGRDQEPDRSITMASRKFANRRQRIEQGLEGPHTS
jgi:hypothetical protein